MFPEDAPDGSAGAGAPVSDAQPGFPLGASRDATSRRIPPSHHVRARLGETPSRGLLRRRRRGGGRGRLGVDRRAFPGAHGRRHHAPRVVSRRRRVPLRRRPGLRRGGGLPPGTHHHLLVTPLRARQSRAPRGVLLRQPLPRRPPRRPREPLPRASDCPILRARRRGRRRPRRATPSRRRRSSAPRNRLRRRRSKLAVSLPRPQTRRLRVRRRRGDRLGTGRGTLRGFRFDVAGSPGPPDFGPAGRAGPSPGTFARPTPGTLARPTPRRVVIAVDGSDASSRAVRWCRDALLRPTDEVILAHAVSGVSEHAFSRVYAERGVASRPVGGDDAHAAAATRDAWRALERALERAGTTPPYPSLGDGQGRSPGRRGGFLGRGRGASGSSVSGERALASIGQTFGRRGGETGGVSMRVASEGRRDVGAAAGRSASRRERRRRGSDRRGESRDGGWRRAMSPSVSTHLVENAPCPCLVYREPAREDEGGKRGSASVTREDRFQISGPAVSLKPKTKFHR